MTDAAVKISKRPRRIAIAILTSVAAVSCLICCGGSYFLYYRTWDVRRVAARAEPAEKAYRAAGLPWQANDMDPQPPVTEAENAAPLFLQAIKALDGRGFSVATMKLAAPARAGRFAEIYGLLKPFASEMTLAAKAAERPRLEFKRDWDQGAGLLFPELAFFKYFDKAFCARAEAEAAAERDTSCLGDLRTALRLTGLLRSEPMLLGMLTWMSCTTIFDRAVEQAAYFMRDRPASLAALGNMLAFQPAPDLQHALRGEAYMGVVTFRNLDHTQIRQLSGDTSAPPDTGPPRPLVRTGLPKGQIERAWATVHLELWTRVARVLAEHPGDPFATIREFDRINDDLDRHPSVSNMLELIMFPMINNIWIPVKKDRALHRALQALIETMEIRATTGQYPRRLSEVPGTWIDPFTNTPLKYKLTAVGVRIYSVGVELRDHGGVAQSEVPEGSKAYDIIAACPPIPPRPAASH